MSEYSNTNTRGAFVGAVFANQGFGILVSAAVAVTVASCLRAKYPAPPFDVNPAASTSEGADYVWRLVFLFGCLPAGLTYYWRTRMPETARYTALVAGDTKRAADDMKRVLHQQFDTNGTAAQHEQLPHPAQQSYTLFSREFFAKHGLHLLGTSTTWFLAGLPWYTLNLFEKDVLTAVGWLPPAGTMSAIDEVYKVAGAQALIAVFSIVPGYWFTILLIDRIGRKPIQLQGFFFMSAFMLALGLPYNHWRDHNHIAFVVIYAFTFFFCNFGPNTTTFIVPSEIYPARFRTTCHGISAAVGKLGAVLGAFGFQFSAQDPDPRRDDAGYKPGMGVGKTFVLLAGTSALGFLLTFLIPEPKGLSLEDISQDTIDHHHYHPHIHHHHIVELPSRTSPLDYESSQPNP